jgi:hypothetical protein
MTPILVHGARRGALETGIAGICDRHNTSFFAGFATVQGQKGTAREFFTALLRSPEWAAESYRFTLKNNWWPRGSSRRPVDRE